MRDFKGMKRQRSRNRNGGGGGGGGSGGKPQHNANRAFDSNGPEGVKVRGAAQHVYEKYQQLARDAQTTGDRVLAENYLQHAEHYFRLMRAMQPLRPLAEIIGRDQFVSGYDIDFEDDGGGEAADADGDGDVADGADNGAERQPRFEARNREDQPRFERSNGERVQTDRPQNERVQNERTRDDRGGRFNREDRPRFQRDDRAVRAERVERSERLERPERDPLGVIEPEATPLTASPLVASPAPYAAPTASLPPAVDDAPMLRADDGEISHAPAFLQVRSAEPKVESPEQPRRPRRRRAPASFGPPEGETTPSEPEAS